MGEEEIKARWMVVSWIWVCQCFPHGECIDPVTHPPALLTMRRIGHGFLDI
jgi:hypothetical protein